MQDVSSFTMGQVKTEGVYTGLCLVNSGFSMIITIDHIDGTLDLKRKSFWRPNRNPKYNIQSKDDDHITVDGRLCNTIEWLESHRDHWFAEWNRWRQHVAMTSIGYFHWSNDSPIIARYFNRYLTFVEWKKVCYIRPSYEMMDNISVFTKLKSIWLAGHPLGLVHPKAISGNTEKEITKKYLENLFDSEDRMACQPFVVAGKLMGISI